MKAYDPWWSSMRMNATKQSDVLFHWNWKWWQHVLLQLSNLIDSEVKPKCVRWVKKTPPWSPSAWTFAKHWQGRVRPSTSPCPSVPTSPSPWTPGVRKWRRAPEPRSQVPQLCEEMPSGDRTSWKGSKTLRQWTTLLSWQLSLLHLFATCVTTRQPLKRGWRHTRGWSMDLPGWLHLRLLHPPLRHSEGQVRWGPP